MYTPKHFEMDDAQAQFAFMRDNPFAIICTTQPGAGNDPGAVTPEATHIPVLVTKNNDGDMTIRFHLARVNPLVNLLDGDRQTLIIFSGAHTYISPRWYATVNAVPTWNYTAVHAYGAPTALDETALLLLLADLSWEQEIETQGPNWTLNDMDRDVMMRMCKAIVGFEMRVSRLQAKAKLSQNRSAADRQGVSEALAQESTRHQTSAPMKIRALMEANDDDPPT